MTTEQSYGSTAYGLSSEGLNPPVNSFNPTILLPCLRAHLVTLGLVREPAVQGDSDSNPPPMWLDPRRGVPYPGQKEDVGQYGFNASMVLGAYPETGIPSGPFEGFYLRKAVSIWYRGKNSPLVQNLHQQISSALHDHRNYSLHGLQVNQSMMTRELQRLTSDDEGYMYNSEYMFDLWNPNYTIP